jgi:beta-glucosidase
LSIKPEFPPDFLWGAATSAYQVEGSPLADGAGPSIWQRFSRLPGKVQNGDSGDIACDHYRRFRDDVRLMKELGLQAYRFSIAWGRVFPQGRGRRNERGLDFYRQLVECLREHGIEPFVTLYHWDLPQALDDLGGWANRDSAEWFADYAHAMFRALDGDVKLWTTLNEPWVVAHEGYLRGTHAPGHASLTETPRVSHNLLRAHALAARAFRADGQGQIGLVVNLEPKHAASESATDRMAVAHAHAYMNRQYLDPLFLGAYPEEMAGIFGDAWPSFPDEEMKLLREPFDFLGVNYYTRSVNRHDPAAPPLHASPVWQAGAEYTQMEWEEFPAGLTEALLWVKRRYGDIPLYVTENGAAFDDPPPHDGRLEDPRRVAYLRSHLGAVRAALEQGVDVRGYFAWSLFDNFEWSHGYSKTFGLVHVNPATQQRTPKDSALFYRDVIASGGENLEAGWRNSH